MTYIESIDWSKATEDEQMLAARAASKSQMRELACRYDWTNRTEAVLSWMMAQKSMDLGSALTAFFNGEPERFNYIPKRDVPGEHRCTARILDNICLRVNSGFYLVRPGYKLQQQARLTKWLEYQQADRLEGRRGRWILDEKIVAAVVCGKLPMPLPNAPQPTGLPNLIQAKPLRMKNEEPEIRPGLLASLQRFLPRRT